MKLSEVFAHLSVMNQEPLGGFTELYRALREESGKLAATERKLAKAAAAAGYTPPDWGGRFTDLFVGRSGPGGGVDVTPAVLAFFLSSYLIEAPRRDAAAKALNLSYAAYTPFAPTFRAPPWLKSGDANSTVCPKTNQRLFGSALMTLLSDPELLNDAPEIFVCTKLGLGGFMFADGTISHFMNVNFMSGPKVQTGSYSTRHMPAEAIRQIAAGLTADQSSAA